MTALFRFIRALPGPVADGRDLGLVATSKDILQRHGGNTMLSQVVPALVACDPIDPGEQGGAKSEAGQAPESLEEDVLEDVLRLKRVADKR